MYICTSVYKYCSLFPPLTIIDVSIRVSIVSKSIVSTIIVSIVSIPGISFGISFSFGLSLSFPLLSAIVFIVRVSISIVSITTKSSIISIVVVGISLSLGVSLSYCIGISLWGCTGKCHKSEKQQVLHDCLDSRERVPM